VRVEEFSEALSARLHAELDEVPVPARDWIAARPDLGRRVRNRRVRHGVAAAVAVAVVASAAILAGAAVGHGRGPVPAQPATLTPLASRSFREPCCGPPPAADLTYGNGWLFAQLMTQDRDRLLRLNPRSLRVTGSLQGGSMPVYADGAVWVVSSRHTLWRINPATLRITRRIPIRGQVNALAVGDGALWLAVCTTGESDGNCRGASQRLQRIDPASGQVTASGNLPVASGWVDLAVGRVILVSGEDSPVYAIDPQSLTLRQTFHVNCDGCQGATGVAVGPGGLYAVSVNRVVRLSLASGRMITQGPQLPFSFAGTLEVARGSLWLGTEQGTFRLDPVTLAPTARVIAANDRLILTGDTEQAVVAGGSVYVSFSGGLARYSDSVSR
jgi:outer membrane protein assembly factor BamB